LRGDLLSFHHGAIHQIITEETGGMKAVQIDAEARWGRRLRRRKGV